MSEEAAVPATIEKAEAAIVDQPVKRGRGRPRKSDTPTTAAKKSKIDASTNNNADKTPTEPKRRGRPPKTEIEKAAARKAKKDAAAITSKAVITKAAKAAATASSASLALALPIGTHFLTNTTPPPPPPPAPRKVNAATSDAKRRNLMEEFDDFCYFKKDLIGHGAFAIVYKGRYKSKNVEVAIKAIAKKNISKAKSLLTKEIRILKELSGLKHENLVTLLKCVEEPSHVFLVMEYCNGGDLGDYLGAREKISETAIRHFFVQIARALEAMKLKDIVHRDLKPQNILLCKPHHRLHDIKAIDARELVVKLADFGFARFLTGDGMAGTLCGSPMYMAPEVIMSLQYCAKADLWSVGTIMYQCLVGKAPFIAQTPQALKNFYERNKELRPNVPAHCSLELSDLLVRLLKRNPRDRIEFVEFFNHPFLHMQHEEDSAPPRSGTLRADTNAYYAAAAAAATNAPNTRTKFPTTTPPAPNLYGASGGSGGSSPRFHNGVLYQQQLEQQQSPLLQRHGSQTTRYASAAAQTTAGASPRAAAAAVAAERQAPLRPTNSPTTARRPTPAANAPPLSYASGATFAASPRHFSAYNLPGEVVSKNAAAITAADAVAMRRAAPHGAKPPAQPAANLGAAMSDSNDFTFLPPLDKNSAATGNARYPPQPTAQQLQQQQLERRSQMNLQFSNASSSATGGDNNPVKQVQVHSSVAQQQQQRQPPPPQDNDRGDPVPSQRLAYAQMQERRKASTAGGGGATADASAAKSAQNHSFERRIPSVEELNLPETQFVVHNPPPRPNTRSNLFGRASPPAKTVSNLRAPLAVASRGAPSIPKSATYAEFAPRVRHSPAASPSASSSSGGNGGATDFATPAAVRAPINRALSTGSSLGLAGPHASTAQKSNGATATAANAPAVAIDNIRFLTASPSDEDRGAVDGVQSSRSPRVKIITRKASPEEEEEGDSESEDENEVYMDPVSPDDDDDDEDDDRAAADAADARQRRAAAAATANNDEAADEEDDEEDNAMEESTISQVMDSITGDEELATLRRVQNAASNSQQHNRGGGILGEAAAADLLFFNATAAADAAAAAAAAAVEPPSELEAETVLDGEHRQILAKLRFVLELIETLVNVAEKKTNPMAMIMEGGTRKASRQQSSGSTGSAGSGSGSEVSRRAEQLVLYVRSLHVLSSALVMAQRQINADALKPSPAVQTVLNQLNEKYHHCLARSQELASLGIPGMDPSMTVVSAERIMYQHAIDLCQSAALDELFGHPQLCPKRYQTAYMMLHTLFEQVQNEQDKSVLAKYKNAVEKRMRILEQQGFVTAVKSNTDPAVLRPHHFSHNSLQQRQQQQQHSSSVASKSASSGGSGGGGLLRANNNSPLKGMLKEGERV